MTTIYQAEELTNKKPEELIKYEGKGFASDYFGNQYYQYGNGYKKITKEVAQKKKLKIQIDEKFIAPIVNKKNP